MRSATGRGQEACGAARGGGASSARVRFCGGPQPGDGGRVPGSGQEVVHDAVNGSVSISGEELPVAPEAPTGLTAIEGEDAVELSWNASANTDTYYIYRDGAGLEELIGSTDGIDFFDNNIESIYEFGVVLNIHVYFFFF